MFIHTLKALLVVILVMPLCTYTRSASIIRVKSNSSMKKKIAKRKRRLKKVSKSLPEKIRLRVMSDVILRDHRIYETNVFHFLKESSAGKVDVQHFYEFIMTRGYRPEFKSIKSLFISWLVLNTSSLFHMNLISARQLSNLVTNLSAKEIAYLDSVFLRAHELMRLDKALTPDLAFQKVMQEKGINAERLRKCKG